MTHATRRVAAIRSSLRILAVAPLCVMASTQGAAYRAPLGDTDFSVALTGPTGAGKSELAALAQQHYGPSMDARNLPGSWSSTANASEELGFHTKDAIIVLDDYAPTGSQGDMARLNRDADRLLRGQGNRSGRQRMRSDATLRAPRPVRATILSTGEDVPKGQSLRGRMWIVELGPHDVNWALLTGCQQDAANGLYAQALAAYIQWIAGRYEVLKAWMATRRQELRQKALVGGGHRRTPGIVADLALGWEVFLSFAVESEALTQDEADQLNKQIWAALGEVAARQADHQNDSEPTQRFLEWLRGALVSGNAHLMAPDGTHPKPPCDPTAWGWRNESVGDIYDPELWSGSPRGTAIGWVTGDAVYLDPQASYTVAQRMARDQSDDLGITIKTLHKRLHEQGLLASIDTERKKLTVRRTLSGTRRNVLHLRPDVLLEGAQPAQPTPMAGNEAHADSDERTSGPIPWADSAQAA